MFDSISNWFSRFRFNWESDSRFRQRTIITAVLILIGIGLASSPLISRWLVNSYHPAISKADIQKNNHAKGTFNYASVHRLSMANIAKARAQAGNIKIVGEIAIPQDHIYLPIAKGINPTVLALAAGTFRPDMKMGHGNYALAGHNMANHSKILFSPLYDDAKPGQKIYLSDLSHVYTYRMTQRKIIDPSRVDVVKNQRHKMITLITCDETGSHRLMIRGKFIRQQKLKHAPHHVQNLFKHHFTTKN